MFGACEDGEAFVDLGVDLGELPPGVAVAEVVAPTTSTRLRSSHVLARPLQVRPQVGRSVRADLGLDRGDRPWDGHFWRSQRPGCRLQSRIRCSTPETTNAAVTPPALVETLVGLEARAQAALDSVRNSARGIDPPLLTAA